MGTEFYNAPKCETVDVEAASGFLVTSGGIDPWGRDEESPDF